MLAGRVRIPESTSLFATSFFISPTNHRSGLYRAHVDKQHRVGENHATHHAKKTFASPTKAWQTNALSLLETPGVCSGAAATANAALRLLATVQLSICCAAGPRAGLVNQTHVKVKRVGWAAQKNGLLPW